MRLMLSVLGCLFATSAFAMVGVPSTSTAPRDLIVQYKSQSLAAAAPSGSVAVDAVKPGLRVMHYDTEEALAAAQKSLQSDPNVQEVHRAIRETAAFVPNDPLYPQQWDKTIQHLEVADGIETGQAPVLLLIVDTAWDCSSHPDLAPNCRQDLSKNFITDPNIFFHGYHVAGIAAASINNGVDIAGTAGTVQIAFARFLDGSGNGSSADALTAWNYAIQLENQGYRVVVNNSWGGGGNDTSLQAAATAMKAAGVVNVAAAGNNHTDNCATPFYPAAYPEVLPIAATDSTDALASFSNFGQCVWLAAPGVNITSLTNAPPGTAVASGTSMASPQVAGAAALLLSQQPTLTPDQVKAQLASAAVKTGVNVLTGARLDLANLLKPAVPGFRLSTQCPVPAVVDDGSTLNCTVDTLGLGGLVDPITLTCSGVTNATCAISPTAVTPGNAANLILTPSTTTPAPKLYQLSVQGVDDGITMNATPHSVQVYPPGTATFNYSVSSPNLWFATCSNPTPPNQPCPWPPWTGIDYLGSVSDPIAVPDNNSVVHLSGSVNIAFQGAMSATLTSPKGTVYNLPLPNPLLTASGGDYAFDTDVFDNEPTKGTWALTVTTTANWWGHLNGWKMAMLAAPLGPPPPPPSAIDLPSLSFSWADPTASTCTASGAWSGNEPVSGNVTLPEPFAGTYTLTCNSAGGTATRTLTIGVQ